MSAEPGAHGGPALSGDLTTVLGAAPMFRRSPLGYDRFEVDTYVRWAEDELATADREREHLTALQSRTLAALEDARELLAHSAGGADVLRLSRRMGTLLATAADEAAAIRADAEAEARRMAARGEHALAEATAEAARIVADAIARARQSDADARQTLAEAARILQEARAEATARRAQARAVERRAVRDVQRLRRQAVAEAAAARLQARHDAVQLLTTGREERRRADAAAAVARERLDSDVAARRAQLLEQVEELERRRAALRADLERLTAPVPLVPDSLGGGSAGTWGASGRTTTRA